MIAQMILGSEVQSSLLMSEIYSLLKARTLQTNTDKQW